MFSELVRPITSEVRPILTPTTLVTGQRFALSTPEEFGITIYVDTAFFTSEAGVELIEANQPEQVDVHINTRPYLGYVEFIRANTFRTTNGVVEQRARRVREASSGDALFAKYAVERPSQLCIVEGEKYRFIAGDKPDSVFVDGWIKKAQVPSWRVHIPKNTSERTPLLVIPNSRLLIFAAG